MGAGAMTICHNKTAVQVREDMKKMVQIPILRSRAVAAKHTKLFGVSMFELQEQGLLEDGVPMVVRRMVEHLIQHALHQEGLFRVNGNVRAVETLKLRLESGDDVDLLSESDLCTVASLLKRYLRDLPGGLVDSTVQQELIRYFHESGDSGSCLVLRDLLQQLPDVHHSLLRYLCHFLTLVEKNHEDNRMTTHNLATVFGPSVFHVAPGLEAIKDQNICNKIMAKLIQNYSSIFETETEDRTEQWSTLITVKTKEAHVTDADTKKSPSRLKAEHLNAPENVGPLSSPTAKTRQKKVRKRRNDGLTPDVCQPSPSGGMPHARFFSIPIVLPLTSELRSPSPEVIDTTPQPQQDTLQPASPHVSLSCSTEGFNSFQDEDRPVSPFYMSNHLSPVRCRPDVVNFLDQTIRSAVEQHLFDVNPSADQHSETFGLTARPSSTRVTTTARQRRRLQREQQEEGLRERDRKKRCKQRA